MRIVETNAGQSVDELAREASDILARGGLVVLPTETVYGLCADSADPSAMLQIYSVKGRDEGKPVAWLVSGLDDVVRSGASVPAAAEELARAFWPGPLTLVLDTPHGTQGYRVPDHDMTLAVIRRLGRAVAATSANRSGEPDARTAAEAAASIGSGVDLIVDAGPSPGGVPSTVVRVEAGGGWKILRAGALKPDCIARAAGGGKT